MPDRSNTTVLQPLRKPGSSASRRFSPSGEASSSSRRFSVKVYSKGARVSQPNYGPGTVTDADAHHTVIDFDNHGLKRFVTTMVALAPSSEPAPEKAKAVRRKKAVKATKTAEV